MLRAFVTVLFAAFIASCGPSGSSRQGGGLSCEAEEALLSDYTGIGINHTANVEVALKNSNGRTMAPSLTQQSTTSNGIRFEAKVYLEGDIVSGTYDVEVIANGREIQNYKLTLSNSRSPILTIFCN